MSDERILVCDDDDDVRAIVEMALAAVGGFSVTPSSSGHAALELFSLVKPDLVILDVMMPEMDGPTTLARLRALPGGDAVPVVFLSAKTQRSEVERLRAYSVLDVLEKPFDPMALPQLVRSLLDRAATRGIRA